jgi:hypothetical protein
MPAIIIIPLAIRKMGLRGIPGRWVEETLSSPDETVPGYGGRLVAQRVYVVNRKRMMLRVVYERVNKDYVVVTAYLTSQVTRYRK